MTKAVMIWLKSALKKLALMDMLEYTISDYGCKAHRLRQVIKSCEALAEQYVSMADDVSLVLDVKEFEAKGGVSLITTGMACWLH
jgi:hypothetical protein